MNFYKLDLKKARLGGFEPPTYSFHLLLEGCRSIQAELQAHENKEQGSRF